MVQYGHMAETTRTGTFIISLDFELMWGMFDKVTAESYGANLAGVHDIVPQLLTCFTERGIHATWATVGMLMHEREHDLVATMPAKDDEPQYVHTALSAYEHLRHHQLGAYPNQYFGAHLVEQIVATPHQELASHTYAHYYCLEEQTVSGEKSNAFFTADCRAFAHAVRRFGVTPTSIVFPRNQWSSAALSILTTFGFTAFRGTEQHTLYRARTDTKQRNIMIRAFRLLDHYCNISGHHTYALTKERIHSSGLINIPASRFLRPWSAQLALLEPLRRYRIKRSMTHAAKHGEVFHLWWHPHNFGKHQTENMKTLNILLDHFTYLKHTYGMESNTMYEAATRVHELTAPNV